MAPTYLLGIDVGTQSTKGALVTLDGQVVAYHAVEHGVSRPFPGWAEQDAGSIWWGDVVRVTRVLLRESHADPRAVAAIGVSALAPAMVPVNADGQPLRPGVLYGIDTRAHTEVEQLNRDLGWDAPSTPPAQRLQAQSVVPKILWFRKHEPERWRQTGKLLGATGFVVHRLTGVHAIDNGNAEAWTPCYDASRGQWDAAMCERVGVPRRLLPEIRAAADVVGEVTPEAARQTGLAEGTPVICGSMDVLAEYLSAGAIQADEGCLVFGSTMCLCVLSAEPRAHPSLYGGCSLVPGLSRLSGGMATAGALARWFRDGFSLPELQTERESGVSAYHLLDDAAAAISPGSDGIVVLPYFSGERTPVFDAQARGMILGLTVSHTRAHLYRGLLEGVAYGVRHHLDLMAEAGVTPRRLVAVGGGSQSSPWMQIVSDVTGRPLECVERPIGAALADAFLAGYGIGLFRDLAPLAEDWVRIGRTVQPDAATTAIYERYYRVYRRLYARTAEEMHELAQLSARQL
ncbi:MAG: sugar kinase [Chloroflexi bacterium]|nr:sugar kinase [Chloroflexota bacterium]